MFTLPSLSYAYDALEPHIDAKTMEIHHTKHHQTYVDKLNEALKDHPDLQKQSVEALLRSIDTLPAAVQPAVRNHAGGHANHTLFWEILNPQDQDALTIDSEMGSVINATFGSIEQFKTAFTTAAAGQFGSGWAWLVVTQSGELKIITTANQDSPFMQNQTPIFGVDVWEHAYYLQYQNRRPDYLAAIWNSVNWNVVYQQYLQATAATKDA